MAGKSHPRNRRDRLSNRNPKKKKAARPRPSDFNLQEVEAMMTRFLIHPLTADIITLIGLPMLSLIPSCNPALPGVIP